MIRCTSKMSRKFSAMKEGPFILDRLLEIPELVSDLDSPWEPFQQASNLFTLESLSTGRKKDSLPELRTEFFGLDSYDDPLSELDSFADSTSASEIGEAAPNHEASGNDDLPEDVWSLRYVVGATKENQLVNWNSFLRRQAENPGSAYLSEAGPTALDAVLASDALRTKTMVPKLVAQHEDVLRSLFELGIGRDSLFYRYDRRLAEFVMATEDFGLSGISFEVQQDVLQDMLRTGNRMRKIRASIAEPQSGSLLIALDCAISTVLYTVEAELQKGRPGIRSIIQLIDLFSRPNCLTKTLLNLVMCFSTTCCTKTTIIELMHEAENLVSHHPWQAPLVHEILRRSSAAWTAGIEVQVGLRPSADVSELRTPTFLVTGEAHELASGNSQETPLTDVEKVVLESRGSLDIIRAEQPDHPVLNSPNSSLGHLSWEMSWEAIARIQTQADRYEQALKQEVLKYSQGTSIETLHTRHSEFDEDDLYDDEEGMILIDLNTPNALDGDLGGRPSLFESRLAQLTTAALGETIEYSGPSDQSELCPPLTLSLSLSLTPLLDAQSRLLSFSTLRLLFKAHSLRNHLSVQHRFQLLSDGPFASRLSRALFDPDQFTGEGRRSVEGTTGLRLQARDTWPPASSELRLALMGILSESYHSSDWSGVTKDDLPGNLSFAIRDLSGEELEKCRDVASIEALDFLRLQYKPSATLESVITQSSLRKYDKIFRYMLRLLRMQAVAQSLLRQVSGRNVQVDRTNQRCIICVQHFISTLAAYSSNDAIGVEWLRFQETLKKIEAAIDRADYEGTIAMAGSLSRLERLHDEVLDRIIRALFLNRRQAQVRDVIDGIFRLILRFAAITRPNDDGQRRQETREISGEFTKQIGKLMRYLRSQDLASTTRTNGEAGISVHPDGEAPFERFLLKLDLLGYFT
jgi:Gamma tubulin complex component C-terminal/Gamma tubulin complex component N-terminal